MKKLILLVLVLFGILAAACGPIETPVDPSQVAPEESTTMQVPESDNGKSWSLTSMISFDTQVYTLRVKAHEEVSSTQSINGQSFGYNGYSYGRVWTDGKGVIAVDILEMSPSASWVDTSLPYILKTSDIGVMAIPVGAEFEIICNHDVEVLSPVFNYQTLTTDRLTDELDSCRLITKNYTPAE